MEEMLKTFEEKLTTLVESAVETALYNYGVINNTEDLQEKVDDIYTLVDNIERNFKSFQEDLRRAFRN